MATVQVLCPNGRRQNVKLTPNSKLLQVLEEVCQKQGFLPAEDYKLVHGRKDLDLSLSFRYANLPNNAKLELLKLEKARAEESVVIALQLESGDRLQHSFSPGVSLWEVLQHWEHGEHAGKLTVTDGSQTPPVHPVCIYMREEVIGQCALQTTTIRKLGLTSGKAVIRLVRRPVEDSVIAEIMGKIEKDKVKEAKLGEIAARKQAELVRSTSSEHSAEVAGCSDRVSQPRSDTSVSGNNKSRGEVNMEAQSSCDESDSKMLVAESEMTGQEAMDVDKTESAMLISQADSSSNRNTLQGRSPGAARGQAEIEQLRSLNIPGVEIFTPNDFNDLPPDQQELAKKLAQRMMRQLMGGSTEMPAAPSHSVPRSSQRRNQPQSFSDFKFPDSSKGKSLYSNELSEVDREEYKPCDREAVLYNLEESVIRSDSSTDDLPDNFFELTEADMNKLMSDLQKNVEHINDAPMMTTAMRQAKLEEKYGKYAKVVIRIQFPDKLVLQGLFRPRETVFALQKFVKENLEDKSQSFYLYTTPPKCILKDKTSTLIEANLVPATLVYFGSEVEAEHYLSEAVRAEISSKSRAEVIAFQSLPKTEEADEPTSSASGQKSRGADTGSTGTSKGGGGKAPKWLKLGKKK